MLLLLLPPRIDASHSGHACIFKAIPAADPVPYILATDTLFVRQRFSCCQCAGFVEASGGDSNLGIIYLAKQDV